MMNFEKENVKVEYDLEALTLKDLSVEKSKKITCKSKSEFFRTIYDMGVDVCDISRICNAHYSFVYGVISSSREIRKVEKKSKSDDIRRLFDDGKTPGEIAKLLNSNYSFVFSVVKKYKESKQTV